MSERIPGAAKQEEFDVGFRPGLAEPQLWPEKPHAQVDAENDLLNSIASPISAEDAASAFKGRLDTQRRRGVQEVLAIMADLGIARYGQSAKLYAPRR